MYPRNINYSVIGLNHEYLYKRVDRSGLKGNLKCSSILVSISNTENWLVSQEYKLLATHMSALFLQYESEWLLWTRRGEKMCKRCLLSDFNLTWFLVDIKTNWFIIICVAQGFRVVQYFLDFSETQCCSKPCSLNPCSSRTHCT